MTKPFPDDFGAIIYKLADDTIKPEEHQYLDFMSQELTHCKKSLKWYFPDQFVRMVHSMYILQLTTLRKKYREEKLEAILGMNSSLPIELVEYIESMDRSVCEQCKCFTDSFLFGEKWLCLSCYNKWYSRYEI